MTFSPDSYRAEAEYELFIIQALQLAKEWEGIEASGGLCKSLTVDRFPMVCRALLALHRELQDERRDTILKGHDGPSLPEKELLRRIADAGVIFPSMCANNMEALNIVEELRRYATKGENT